MDIFLDDLITLREVSDAYWKLEFRFIGKFLLDPGGFVCITLEIVRKIPFPLHQAGYQDAELKFRIEYQIVSK